MRQLLAIWLVFGCLGVSGTGAADPLDDPEELENLPEPDSAYYRYLKARRLKCYGDGERLERPVEMKLGGRTFLFDGPGLKLQGADRDGVVTLGVLGAVKDYSPELQKGLRRYLKGFREHRVDAIVLLGDIAGIEYELTQVLLACAQENVPVLALIGNSESRAAFNRSVLAALRAHPHIINMDIVRRIDLGGAVLVSLPGYRNRKFVHQTAGCNYKTRDIPAMAALVEGAGKPVVLLAHGPPKDAGKRGLDFASEGGNVGDPAMAAFMRDHQVRFGVFSHILEAGGRAHDVRRKPVRPGKYSPSLLLNVGSANPLPWQLNSGKLSCGMAAVVRIRKNQGSYTWLKLPCPR